MNVTFNFKTNTLRIDEITTDRFLIDEYERLIKIFIRNTKGVSFNVIREIFDIPWPFGMLDSNSYLGNEYGWEEKDLEDINLITCKDNTYGLIFPGLKKFPR